MRRLALLALPLALAACGRSATFEPCPGEAQGRFRLSTAPAPGADAACADALQLPAPSPTVVVSFLGASGAALCPDAALAPPLTGTRAGDAVEVASPPTAASVPACPCATRVVERITGALGRDAGGAAISFAGELVNELSLADPAACAPADAARCAPLPCTARWTVTSAP